MKKILYILFLLPMLAFGQDTTVNNTPPSNTTAISALSYRFGFVGGKMQLYANIPQLGKWWRLATTQWVNEQFDQPKNYVRLTNTSDISFNSTLWKDRQLMTYDINAANSTQFPQVNIVPGNALGWYWTGTVFVNKQTGTGFMTAWQWDSMGQIYYKYERTKDDGDADWGQWTRIWTSASLPLGSTGQSIRVRADGQGFEAYTPSAGNTGTVTNVSATNANGFTWTITNSTTTPNITALGDTVGYFMGKVAANLRQTYYLSQFTARELIANKVTTLASPNNTTYPTTKAVSDALAAEGLQAVAARGNTYSLNYVGNDASLTPRMILRNTATDQGDGVSTFNRSSFVSEAGNGQVIGSSGSLYNSGGIGSAYSIQTATNHPIIFRTNIGTTVPSAPFYGEIARFTNDGYLQLTQTPQSAGVASYAPLVWDTSDRKVKQATLNGIAGAALQVTANGGATTVTIPHGLISVTSTSRVFPTARNAAAGGWTYVDIDATNVYIYYPVATTSGTGNLKYDILIRP